MDNRTHHLTAPPKCPSQIPFVPRTTCWGTRRRLPATIPSISSLFRSCVPCCFTANSSPGFVHLLCFVLRFSGFFFGVCCFPEAKTYNAAFSPFNFQIYSSGAVAQSSVVMRERLKKRMSTDSFEDEGKNRLVIPRGNQNFFWGILTLSTFGISYKTVSFIFNFIIEAYIEGHTLPTFYY